jgi:hypothetical protein
MLNRADVKTTMGREVLEGNGVMFKGLHLYHKMFEETSTAFTCLRWGGGGSGLQAFLRASFVFYLPEDGNMVGRNM